MKRKRAGVSSVNASNNITATLSLRSVGLKRNKSDGMTKADGKNDGDWKRPLFYWNGLLKYNAGVGDDNNDDNLSILFEGSWLIGRNPAFSCMRDVLFPQVLRERFSQKKLELKV